MYTYKTTGKSVFLDIKNHNLPYDFGPVRANGATGNNVINELYLFFVE